MSDNRREALEALLSEYDAGMSGEAMTESQREGFNQVSVASAFAAAASESSFGGGEAHALARAFLIALIDASDERLDYLRSDPASGDAARQANTQLSALISETPKGETP